MAELRLDGGLNGFFVSNVAPLTGGGFAVLVVNGAQDRQVVLFERTGDGSIRQVGSAIDIPEEGHSTSRRSPGAQMAVSWCPSSLTTPAMQRDPHGLQLFHGGWNPRWHG